MKQEDLVTTTHRLPRSPRRALIGGDYEGEISLIGPRIAARTVIDKILKPS